MEITVPEAARRTGKNPETIRRWIRSGRLRSHRVGTQHLVEDAEVAALAEPRDSAPLLPEWEVMWDGQPQIDWVRLVRESRDSH
mgnify:CR=1 FL=1